MKQDKETRMDSRRNWWANRWFMPSLSLLLGAIMWVAFWAGGNPTQGAYSFGVMAVLGAVILFGGRSDTIRGLRGDGRDERWAMIDQRATAFSGLVLITAVLVAFFVEIANGRDGSPYGQLGAIAGLAYIAAILIGRWKS